MDAVKHVRIPLDIAAYAESHHILELTQELVRGLVIEQPDDPLEWLIRELKKPERLPRVLVLGPPAVGKRSVASRLAAELQAVHLSTDSLEDVQTRPYLENNQVIPAELLCSLVQQRLAETDCFNRGWIMDGIIQSRLQALALQRAGILPEHVVHLFAPEDVLQERNQGRMMDPNTGDMYHITFIWPDDRAAADRLVRGPVLSEETFAARLQRYRCEITGLSSAYKHSMKVFNSDQPHEDVYEQVLAFVKTRDCQRTPRVLLLGPPGAGKSLQAQRLSHKYNLVNIGCSELLRAVVEDRSELGAQIEPYLDGESPVPDQLVLQVLEKRLNKEDCSRGWILHGFPEEISQAWALKKTFHHPNRVFFLDLCEEESVDRVCLRATDPVTGISHHPISCPVPSAEVQRRLQTNPANSKEAVLRRFQHFSSQVAGLSAVYPDAIHIDAEQDPQSVFEVLEKKLTTN
ncbi:adenylate kinase 8 [Eucyclogobius newberryi]|uniref:adenylate kinase 8 n=1 Tax=Eucyclogobius newberryi TaxID=166745 RepID=UPI003B59B248